MATKVKARCRDILHWGLDNDSINEGVSLSNEDSEGCDDTSGNSSSSDNSRNISEILDLNVNNASV